MTVWTVRLTCTSGRCEKNSATIQNTHASSKPSEPWAIVTSTPTRHEIHTQRKTGVPPVECNPPRQTRRLSSTTAMKPRARLPLSLKILVWFFLNLVLLTAVTLVLFNAQFRFDLNWVFVTSARVRVEAMRNLISEELN